MFVEVFVSIHFGFLFDSLVLLLPPPHNAISCMVFSFKFFFKFSFDECGMAPSATTMTGILFLLLTFWLFQPFVRFFGFLVFFPAVTDTLINLHHFSALCFSGWYPVRWLAQFCQCGGLVDPQNRPWTCWRNRTCTIPWVIHLFHIRDGWCSSGDIDKFYCSSQDIHVLPKSIIIIIIHH